VCVPLLPLDAQLERERHSQGIVYTPQQLQQRQQQQLEQEQRLSKPKPMATPARAPVELGLPTRGRSKPYLFITDFDKTMIDFDAGERVRVQAAVQQHG